MAQKLTKVAETTTLANTDTMIVVDESVQNFDGTTGALKRIKKEDTGFALASSTNSKIDTKADAIVKSASGSIASFSDGGDDLPMKSLLVNIVPKQSGSGDPSPSNVRPISGYEGVNVTRCGKNLVNPSEIVDGKFIAVSGVESANADRSHSALIRVKPNTSYFMNGYAGNSYFAILALDENKSVISNYYGGASKNDVFVATMPNNARYVYLNFFTTQKSTMAFYEATSNEGYIPYQGNTYPISLGQTVYGGTLDVVSGKLTIEKVAVDLGSLNWGYNPPSGHELFNTLSPLSGAKWPTTPTANNIICSAYVPVQYGNVYNHTKAFSICLHTNGYVYIYDSRYTDATALKTALNGVYLVYELATPAEIQLTPTEVKTLLGSNNIWSESGTVEVQYRADSTLAYNELLSLIASLS